MSRERERRDGGRRERVRIAFPGASRFATPTVSASSGIQSSTMMTGSSSASACSGGAPPKPSSRGSPVRFVAISVPPSTPRRGCRRTSLPARRPLHEATYARTAPGRTRAERRDLRVGARRSRSRSCRRPRQRGTSAEAPAEDLVRPPPSRGESPRPVDHARSSRLRTLEQRSAASLRDATNPAQPNSPSDHVRARSFRRRGRPSPGRRSRARPPSSRRRRQLRTGALGWREPRGAAPVTGRRRGTGASGTASA